MSSRVRSQERLRLVGEDDVAYDSAKGLGEQTAKGEALSSPSLDDFDKRLREATGGSEE